jgi:glycosyltransferase involved in cell wall biosynthesis
MNQRVAGVSAVIPTHGRPELLRRAVEAVRAQTVPVQQIVVVVDGAEDEAETLDWLSSVDEPRLQVLPLAGRNGPSRARNAGVEAATSPWIAFCDDDDVWLPHKLAWQLKALGEAGWHDRTVVTSGVIGRTPDRDYRWPSRFIGPGDRLGDYLFCTRTPYQGETLLHTSTLLASRSLLRSVPFDETLWNHEDWDWLLRADDIGARSLAVTNHLVVWHLEEERDGLGGRLDDWERSLSWARRRRRSLGSRAFAAFCLTVVAGRARASRSVYGLVRTLATALPARPPLRNVAWFPLYSLLTPEMRRRLRACATRGRDLVAAGERRPWRSPTTRRLSPVASASVPPSARRRQG